MRLYKVLTIGLFLVFKFIFAYLFLGLEEQFRNIKVRLVTYFFISIFASIYVQSQQPKRMYLGNLEPGKVITIFNDPKVNSTNCTILTDPKTNEPYCQEAVGWPNRDAEIYLTGKEKTIPVQEDGMIKDFEIEEFVEINFSYDIEINGVKSIKSGTGWVSKDILTDKLYKPLISHETPPSTIKEVCPPKPSINSVIKAPVDILNLKDETQVLSDKKIAEDIYSRVGRCPFKPPHVMPSSLPSGNAYDKLVMPRLNLNKLPTRSNGQKITKADIINIDALARTMYGEMGGCFTKGLHYPMAVARIALNRIELKDTYTEFINKKQNLNKPTLTKILASPNQFNNWQHTYKARIKSKPNEPTPDPEYIIKPNPSLHQSLCPPTSMKHDFWNGKPTRDTIDRWQEAVEVATMAVLDHENFMKMTNSLKGLYYYTSNVGRFGRPGEYIQVKPSIDGRKLNNTSCIEIWKETDKARAARKQQ